MEDRPVNVPPAPRRDEARIAARSALDSLLSSDPELQDLTLGEILRIAPGRRVARGWWRGEGVILKQFLGEQGPQTAINLGAELARLAPHMSQGRTQVNRLLALRPAHGLVVLSELPGEKMSKLLPRATPQERARMLGDAGQFTLAYSKGRRRADTIGAGYWMRKFARFAPARLAPADRALFAALHDALARQAAPLQGAPLCRAAVHGDFVPVNLHADADGVYGFDTQGEAVMPLSFDLARFLAWLAMDEVQPAGPTWLGVARSDKRAFLSRGLPPEDEDLGILPFLLGHEIAGRFFERTSDGASDPARAPAARRAVTAYLAGIADVTQGLTDYRD